MVGGRRARRQAPGGRSPRLAWYSPRVLRWVAWCAVLAGVLGAPAVVYAHPLVDEARERFRSADFPGALQTLDRAEGAGDLDRDDVLSLFELRALVHAALGQDAEAEEALRALASISPSHRFGREVPPDVVQRFRRLSDALPGPVSVEVGRSVANGRVRLEPRASNDVLDLLRHVRVHARVEGGAWQEAADRPLTVGAEGGQRVEWYAVGVGPGGAPIGGIGSPESPMTFTVGRDPLAPADDSGSAGPWLWVGLGVGAAAIAVAVTVLVVGASSGEPDTVVDGPHGFP